VMLAHHEALLVAQAAAPIGLTGWAAIIGARWYSLSHRSSPVVDRTPIHARDQPSESPAPEQGTS